MPMLLRSSKDGIARGKVSNILANKILSECPGKWVEKKFVGEGDTTIPRNCYVFTQDMVFGSTTGLAVFLWEGDYMYNVPE